MNTKHKKGSHLLAAFFLCSEILTYLSMKSLELTYMKGENYEFKKKRF